MIRLLIVFLLGIVPFTSAAQTRELKLATTTTIEDSGLLKWLLPPFETKSGWKVRTLLGGTGQALKYGRNGDVDVILSHSPSDERKFLEEGFGVARYEVMVNDFVLVGPADDPAKVRGGEAHAGFKRIAQSKSVFVSRGDESGTHRMEQRIWRELGIEPEGRWYLSAGLSMGEVLRIASEKAAYTLTDRGTFAAKHKDLELTLLAEGKPALVNQYAVIPINPRKHAHVQVEGANAFVKWILSSEGQKRIADYRIGTDQVFFPNAK